MNFAADYSTAYELLRNGGAVRHQVPIGLQRKVGEILVPMADAVTGTERLYQVVKSGSVGRVKAAIYAFKLVKEMKRQRILMNAMFDIKEENPARIVKQRSIKLFPITVNRTVVQMREPRNEN